MASRVPMRDDVPARAILVDPVAGRAAPGPHSHRESPRLWVRAERLRVTPRVFEALPDYQAGMYPEPAPLTGPEDVGLFQTGSAEDRLLARVVLVRVSRGDSRRMARPSRHSTRLFVQAGQRVAWLLAEATTAGAKS